VGKELVELMLTAFLGASLVAGVTVTVAVLAGRRALARVRRSRRATVSGLRLRSVAARPGSRGELAAARLRLHTCLLHTERVLRAGSAGPDYNELLIGLQQQSDFLDTRLALLEREPDVALRQALSAGLLTRVDELVGDAAMLRRIAYGFAGRSLTDADPLVADLRDRIAGLLTAMRDLRVAP
jgi:hypothetical protein